MLEKLKKMFNNERVETGDDNRFNRVSKPANIAINSFFIFMAIACILPFFFVIVISLTNEQSLQANGYRLWPEEWSLEAYRYIFSSGSQIVNAYGVSILVTVLGTILGLTLMTTFAYAISRKSFEYRKFFTKLIFIPMLFSGGMVASYLVVVNLLGLKNSLLALILPICVSSFNIIVLRTFFKTTIPDSIIESAKIDGATEFQLFRKIVLPISLPGIATIGLFLTLGFWNDWFQAMLYIDDAALMPLQYVLIKLERSIEFLVNNSSTLGLSAIEQVAKMPTDTSRMAIVVVTTLPIIFAYPFFQKYFVNGLTVGAVKE